MIRAAFSVVACLLLLSGASAGDACTSVADVAESAGLSILLQAVEAAGLVETVNDPDADLTIFAPTDKAFVAALESLDISAEDLLENKELLTEILTYHVVAGAKKAADFGEGGSITTLLGENSSCGTGDVDVVVGEGVEIVGGASSANVELADVEACSTIIHVVDSVLLPCDLASSEEDVDDDNDEKDVDGDDEAKDGEDEDGDEDGEDEEEEETGCTTVAEVAKAAGLTLLLKALEISDLTDAVNDPEAGLTIFAPTNKAFRKTQKKYGYSDEPEAEVVARVLKYHVLAEPKTAAELVSKKVGRFTTLLGDDSVCGKKDLVVRKRGSKVKIFGGVTSSKVVKADIQACSSIIHVVDTVLISCNRYGD